VKSGSNKFWSKTSTRKFFGLFITVIWLATVLQPCVMASFVDSDSSSVESHHSMAGSSDHGITENSGCPHCKAVTNSDDHCDPQGDEVCDEDNSLVYYSRIKPLDSEQLYKPSQPWVILTSRDYEFGSFVPTASKIYTSLNLPTGPPLIDLYCVYLK
jgi:hypothetical protein